jgi:hypothetical protein
MQPAISSVNGDYRSALRNLPRSMDMEVTKNTSALPVLLCCTLAIPRVSPDLSSHSMQRR